MHRDWRVVRFILFWLMVGALAGLGFATVFRRATGADPDLAMKKGAETRN
jgi:hypothetical protein